MEEKRRDRRLELTVKLQLEYIDEMLGEKASKYVEVDVLDISRSGIGFHSDEKLDKDGFYDTEIVIWTNEVIPCVIHIVREMQNPNGSGYQYGGIFIGMNDIEQRKIDIYELFATKDA